MLIKVKTDIIIEVDDDEKAEHASSLINSGLESQMRDFPAGEVVATEVDHWEHVSDEEANEQGWVE